LPTSFYSIASRGEQQKDSRSLSLAAAAAVVAAAVVVVVVVVVVIIAAAPILL
jgi:hypothetical protein